jgi:AcrR family transcriptional regulator
MSPRPYSLGRRAAGADETRAKIVDAAHALFTAADGFSGFSMDAVAKHAGVARMTVYHHFHSKRRLLEALFDRISREHGLRRLAEAMADPDPRAALDQTIAIFAGFWSGERVLSRRLRAVAALDPEVRETLRDRESWRRDLATAIVKRAHARYGTPSSPREQRDAIDALFMLTGFDSFDALAGDERDPQDVVPVVRQLALAALGLSA